MTDGVTNQTQLYTALYSAQSASSGASGSFATLMAAQLSGQTAGSSDAPGLMGGSGGLDGLSAIMMLNDDASIKDALYLLCQMMASGMSSVPSVMQAIPAITAALQAAPDGTVADLRNYLLTGSFSYDVRDKVNAMLFGPEDANYPFSGSKPVSPAVTSAEGDRSAEKYRQVIEQFNVTQSPRYMVNKKGQNDTYCNIFLWDVTLAMGCEIPHYTDPATGEPRTYPDTEGAVEMTANATYNWLNQHGERYGWRAATPEEAQAAANQGKPAVTAWYNPGGHGHVQVVCPSEDGAYDPERGVTVAQAGSRLFEYGSITQVFSGSSLESVMYYVHD